MLCFGSSSVLRCLGVLIFAAVFALAEAANSGATTGAASTVAGSTYAGVDQTSSVAADDGSTANGVRRRPGRRSRRTQPRQKEAPKPQVVDAVEDLEVKVGSLALNASAYDKAVQVDFAAGTFKKAAEFTVRVADDQLAEGLVRAAAPGVFTAEALGDVLAERPRWLAASPVYEFKAGQAPQQPVTVRIRFDKSKLGDMDPRALGIYRQDDRDPARWTYVGGRLLPGADALTVQLRGFSRYAVMGYRPAFGDLDGHWAGHEVEILAARHVVSGVSERVFSPNVALTRAQLARLLATFDARKVDGQVSLARPANVSFEDVAADEWYAPYVEAAAGKGLLKGDKKRFRPNDRVTREELATIVVRLVGAEGQAQAKAVQAKGSGFQDSGQIAPWAKGYVAVARQRGLVKGMTATTFAPRDKATRAQVAVLMLRSMERMGMLEATQAVMGTVSESDVEGRHFELVTKGEGTTYVLLPAADDVAERLKASLGKEVTVMGYSHTGPTIYMRGQVLKVVDVSSVTAQPSGSPSKKKSPGRRPPGYRDEWAD